MNHERPKEERGCSLMEDLGIHEKDPTQSLIDSLLHLSQAIGRASRMSSSSYIVASSDLADFLKGAMYGTQEKFKKLEIETKRLASTLEGIRSTRAKAEGCIEEHLFEHDKSIL